MRVMLWQQVLLVVASECIESLRCRGGKLYSQGMGGLIQPT